MIAAELIRRRLPQLANRFRTELCAAPESGNIYEIEAQGDTIVLRGDCQISLAMAFYTYLKECCHVNWSWCGNREIEVETLSFPTQKIIRRVEQKYRVYMNYCTLCYSAPWWDWARWEKELDFMAMNGINMPLCVVGTEAVWYETLLEYGFTPEESLGYLSGPAWWAWQLMTNIDSFLPPPDVRMVYDRLALGKKILDRAVEWGMTPIQQGFSGHVPGAMVQKFPRAHIVKTGKWCGFPETHQLDPLDPLFKKLGTSLLNKQKELLGAHHFYACDPFHENQPSSKAPGYLKKVGRAVDSLYRTFDPDSTWVMQSWSLRKPIVRAVPKDRLLILCIDGQRRKAKRQFWGYSFVLGNLLNYGGKNSLHGDLSSVASNPYARLRGKNPNLVGTGLFMEGIDQNPLYYDLVFTMLTEVSPADLNAWLSGYARRRYGREESCLIDALRLLKKSCYGTESSDDEPGSIVCARPSIDVQCAAPNDRIGIRYDNRMLLNSAEKLLESNAPHTDGWLFDVCDVTRQVLSNFCQTLYRSAMEAFRTYQKEAFRRRADEMLTLLDELDALLLTREELTLYHWVHDAQKSARSEEERAYLGYNARLQITHWGPPEDPKIFDYAWKEWGGLVGSYYLKRWALFFDALERDFDTAPRSLDKGLPMTYGRPTIHATPFGRELSRFEEQWTHSQEGCVPPKGDPEQLARRLLEKYAPAIRAVVPGQESDKKGNLDFWKQ